MAIEWVIMATGIILLILLLGLMFIPVNERDKGVPRPKYRVVADPGSVPTRAHPTDAGLDLRAAETVKLNPGERRLIGTGVKGAIPTGHVGLITPRSGLAHKYGITVLNAPGTVDAPYRGEVKVNLINLGNRSHVISEGDRVAQMVILPIETMPIVVASSLDTTDRGERGHGSTGVK